MARLTRTSTLAVIAALGLGALSAAPAQALATSGAFTYTVESGKAVITDWAPSSCPTVLVIPATLGVTPVEHIYAGVFNRGVCTSATIKDSRTGNNGGTTTIRIPASVKFIDNKAFEQDDAVEAFEFLGTPPSTVSGAFGCSGCIATRAIFYSSANSASWGASFAGLRTFRQPAISWAKAKRNPLTSIGRSAILLWPVVRVSDPGTVTVTATTRAKVGKRKVGITVCSATQDVATGNVTVTPQCKSSKAVRGYLRKQKLTVTITVAFRQAASSHTVYTSKKLLFKRG